MSTVSILRKFDWIEKFTVSSGKPSGGRISLTDNFLKKSKEKESEMETAIYWEGNYWDDNVHDCAEVDWDVAVVLVNKITNILQNNGFQKGEEVILLMPNMVQLPLAILAASNIGAIAVPINPTISSAQLSTVFSQCTARLILCVDAFWQGHELFELKRTIDKALEEAVGSSIEKLLLIRHVGPNIGMPPPSKHLLGRRPYYKIEVPYTEGRDFDWSDVFLETEEECSIDNGMEADDVVLKIPEW